MAISTNVAAHHSDPIDPTLLEWILHQINAILGLAPISIILILGMGILLFPIGLATAVIKRRRGR